MQHVEAVQEEVKLGLSQPNTFLFNRKVYQGEKKEAWE
jgi:hypothetical protein